MQYEKCELELEQIAEAIQNSTKDQYHGETTPDHLYNINYNLTQLVDAIKTLTTVLAKKKS